MEKEDGEEGDLSESLNHSKICFLSNFPPKECGIATFTKDLVFAMDKKWNPKLKSRVIALNDETDFYNYGNKVLTQLNKQDIEEYINIAKKINNSKSIKLVCIQHEFGLFGGNYGSYLIPFLETIKKPVVVTFHSVLSKPDDIRRKVVRFICSKCSAVIVMANIAVDILHKDYGVNKDKIHVIPHGIPNTSFRSPNFYKKKLKLDNKIVLSTFGLLSRGKGIEYMIKALPSLVKKYPNLLYLVIGETHPVVREREGEEYRKELIKLVAELKLKNNVKFYNKYLSLQEIIHYLLATDIYICTNLDKHQIVSGTLSYALGCGKAIVSTSSTYAKEILSQERGLLANFRNPDSFTKAIDKILSDDELRSQIEKNAYFLGRSMTWPNVASRYLNIFNKVTKLRADTTDKFPAIKLDYLRTLTDDFGCIQFSKFSGPDKSSGYTVDDNARALIAATLHHNLFKSKYSLNLIRIYLNFLEHTQGKDGNFTNNHHNENAVLDPCSEDAFGRAIWSLGYAIAKQDSPKILEQAEKIFNCAYNLIGKLESPRAKAFSIIGLYHHYTRYQDKKSFLKIRKLANFLLDSYDAESSKEWHWFESYLTYSNSKLPEALFLAYEITKNEKYLKIAQKTLKFLSELVFIDNQLSPVGQNGWYNRKGKRSFFDQQPLDTSCMVQTLLTAYSITKDKEYYNKAVLAFNWFLGKNHLKQMVYDEATGGCYDGLSENTLNLNKGAESTASYLIARLMLEETKRNKNK